jgi:hypothetical protein
MLSDRQIQQFLEEGYVILDDAVEPRLMGPLREAAARVTERTRAGGWPYKRGIEGGDIWGIHHLLHPDLGEPAFAEYMATDAVLEVARDLLGGELRMGLVNMLVNPTKGDFEIGWHRDLLRHELPAEEEEAHLARFIQEIVQWNTALYDDACLLIVPGTHRKAATDEERDAQFRRPMEPISTQKIVELKPGQGVYYNNLLIHRGIYSSQRARATIHAALALAQTRAYDIDIEGLEWMAESPGFGASLPEPLQPLFERWMGFRDESRRNAVSGA